jgi:CDP-diacylglycerol--serine O-phosphatidyltransferase
MATFEQRLSFTLTWMNSRLPDFNHDDLAEEDDDFPLALPHSRRKGIYMLPNLFTLAALFGGFYAIVMAMNARFGLATLGIYAAILFDSLDGRVARMTHTQSAFGEQMDSLADMVSFGAAPALIAYEWSLKGLGRWGWIAAFVYCACAALRLARFNVNTAVVDKRWFQGLPSPAAAGLVVNFVWLINSINGGISGQSAGILSWPQVAWITFAITLYAGLTMATNTPFYSFKDMSGRKSMPFAATILIVIFIAIINIHPPRVLFTLAVIYGLSGYAIYAWRKAKGQPASVISVSTDEPDERGLHQ